MLLFLFFLRKCKSYLYPSISYRRHNIVLRMSVYLFAFARSEKPPLPWLLKWCEMETFDSNKKLSYLALSDPGTMKFVYQASFDNVKVWPTPVFALHNLWRNLRMFLDILEFRVEKKKKIISKTVLIMWSQIVEKWP